jgi:hypothetical protein
MNTRESMSVQADSSKIPGSVVFISALVRRMTGQCDLSDPFDRIVDHFADQFIIQVPKENLLEYARKTVVSLFSKFELQVMMLYRGKDLSLDFMADLSKRCGDFFVQVVQDRLERKGPDREARLVKNLETVNEELLQLLKNTNSSSASLP